MPVRVTRRRPPPPTAEVIEVTEVATAVEVPTELLRRSFDAHTARGRTVGESAAPRNPHRRSIPPLAYAQMWFSTIKSGSKLAIPHSATPYLQGGERSIRGCDITHITAW